MEPRAFLSGAAGTPPPLPDPPSIGYPASAAGGVPATEPGPHWFYMIGEESRNLIIKGKVAPSVDDRTQMLRAIRNIAKAAQG